MLTVLFLVVIVLLGLLLVVETARLVVALRAARRGLDAADQRVRDRAGRSV